MQRPVDVPPESPTLEVDEFDLDLEAESFIPATLESIHTSSSDGADLHRSALRACECGARTYGFCSSRG